MKVFIADKLDPLARERLADLGCEVMFEPGTSAEQVQGVLAEHDPDVLIVRSTKVSADAIKAATKLKLIIRGGAGYDTIDVATASSEGIFVANCPGKNAIAVAELTWALILSCDRRVPTQTAELKAGEWNKKEFAKARGLHGRTLGILGLGTIAEAVVERAQAFGMKVVAWSRSLTADRASALGVRMAVSPLEVAAEADVLSVHVASTPQTKHLVNAELIAAMKPGAYLINTSRGAVVDEQALLDGIESKGIRAGLDVYANEPGAADREFDCALAKSPNVFGTHHVGASTEQAQQAIALECARIVEHFMTAGEVLNCVNRAEASAATCILTVRHRNRPGVLAQVFQVLSEARINVEEMENVIYSGAEAASARIQLSTPPSSDDLKRIRDGCADILGLELTPLATSAE